MSLIYQLGIFFYALAARVAALFNEKARFFVNGQKAAFPYLKQQLNHSRPLLWVHCASLGEFEQGRPLIEQIKKEHPGYQVLLTFFSPSGYEIRKNYDQADYVCYLPLDTASNARKFIELTKPEKVFFIKYEFWYNYINQLHKNNIPLFLVSAIFRQEQLFFKSGVRAKWYRQVLQKVTHFFVQTENSAQLLASIGINDYTVTGDTRFDRVAEIAANSKQLPLIEQFKNGQKLIVAGSSWAPDEELLIDFLKQDQTTKIIFAPHEVKESNIKRLLDQLPAGAIRYSQAEGKNLEQAQVLVVDTIGILSSIYHYATVAYIGGGFGVGIHNTLEAAIYNIPVIFGPNYLKFQEAVNLQKVGAAFPITNSEELTEILSQLLKEDEKRLEVAQRCREFMLLNLGATQQVLEKVFNSN
ncbi:glycosyltransferase N-terminal domain-containing protein [uncultured Sunxiuqinia sp.]|uniref:3-deoxy-D-manno-octulosonic acid transferase n=1 Tax=uncultured Sunxiuqinia sp. TaxID=1573825 RepID=UPI002628DAAD|nr:glycosyltransferase N-terminal domain-containing protein [uncultured Sunxiuqinia sp.]